MDNNKITLKNMTTDTTNTFTQIAQVVGTTAAALGSTFTNIDTMLSRLSLVLASAFTIYKFISDRKPKKNK